MAVLNPNNWHWVDKNTLPWSERYFQERLVNYKVNVTSDEYEIVIKAISNIKGDSNVSQRKGKPICYFDLNMGLDIVIVKEEQELTGSISIPEFMHDDDVFEIKCVVSEDKQVEKMVQSEFIPTLRSLLMKYQGDLIEEHSKDLQH